MPRLCALLCGLFYGAMALVDASAAEEAPSPMVSATKLLEEANRLAGEARTAYGPTHEMSPSLERNEALSKIRQTIKASLDKFRLASEVDPECAKASSETVTDLKGMLFWINKSMVVVVPLSLPSPPFSRHEPPPPAMETSSQSIPSVPPPPPSLSDPERTEVAAILQEMQIRMNEFEMTRDQIDTCRGTIRDTYTVLEASREDWEKRHASWGNWGGENWEERRKKERAGKGLDGKGLGGKDAGISLGAVKAYETRRDALLSEVKRSERHLQAKMRETHDLETQIRTLRARLESFRERALPFLAAWSEGRKEGLPEAMVNYLNAQLAKPVFSFTPIPASASFPPVSEVSPAGVQEVFRLLDGLSKALSQDAEIEVTILVGDAETERLQKDLAEIQAHCEWRESYSTPSADLVRKSKQNEEEATKAIAKLSERKRMSLAQRSELRLKIEARMEQLATLDPSLARVLEQWRRCQKTIPSKMEKALETWVAGVLR